MLSQRAPWPLYLIVSCVVVTLLVVTVNHAQHSAYFRDPFAPSLLSSWRLSDASVALSSAHKSTAAWSFDSERDSQNYGLSDGQCDSAFRGLYDEPNRARDHHAKHGIHESDIKIWKTNMHGQVHVLIYGGQIHILNAHKANADMGRAKAALASLDRAITALPDPRSVPNIEFILDIADCQDDAPDGRTAWTWSRHREDEKPFVMPDFDGWSYPDDDTGGYQAFRTKVAAIEKSFGEKTPKAVWRGSTGVASGLRNTLLDASRGKQWADIEPLNWFTKEGFMAMHEFCNYQYVVHTEGNSWSGRLRYLQNCLSVPVIHDLDYVAHYYPLLKPSGPEQNYIPVSRDFSDLEGKMEYYLNHPEEGAALAQRSAATFRDRYLTPAAEACYWRRMVKSWADVQRFEPRLWDAEGNMRGMSWERWAFRQEVSNEHGIPMNARPIQEYEDDE